MDASEFEVVFVGELVSGVTEMDLAMRGASLREDPRFEVPNRSYAEVEWQN